MRSAGLILQPEVCSIWSCSFNSSTPPSGNRLSVFCTSSEGWFWWGGSTYKWDLSSFIVTFVVEVGIPFHQLNRSFFFPNPYYSNLSQRTHGVYNIQSSNTGSSTSSVLTFLVRELFVMEEGTVLVENHWSRVNRKFRATPKERSFQTPLTESRLHCLNSRNFHNLLKSDQPRHDLPGADLISGDLGSVLTEGRGWVRGGSAAECDSKHLTTEGARSLRQLAGWQY